MGGALLNQNMSECTLNTPQAVRSAEVYVDFASKYGCSVPPKRAPEQLTGLKGGFTVYDENQEFWEGRQSIDVQGPNAIGIAKAFNPKLFGRYGDGWRIAPFPVMSEGAKGLSAMWRWAYVVNAQTQHSDVAWAFINFLSEQRLRWLSTVGDIPARSGWDTASLLDQMPWVRSQTADLRDGIPLPETPHYRLMLNLVCEGLTSIVVDRFELDPSGARRSAIGLPESRRIQAVLDWTTEQVNNILRYSACEVLGALLGSCGSGGQV